MPRWKIEKNKKKILGLLAVFLVFGSAAVIQVKASSDTTLIFAESFNQDLSRWGVYTGPNSTVTVQNVVYNSSPGALLVNLSDWQAAVVHEIPAVNADYVIAFLFYPENTSFSNYGLYSDFQGAIDRVKVSLGPNFTVVVNNVSTMAQLTPEYWNTFRLEINYNGTAKVYVNGAQIGVFPSNVIEPTGLMLGTWPARSESPKYSGCGYFDDLKVYITPIQPPQQQQESEPVNVVNMVLVAAGIGVMVVGIVAFLFGRLYFMGRRIESR